MSENQKPKRRRYRTGDKELDAEIAELVAASGYDADEDLLNQLITACFRLARDRSDRGEMKLVNAALKEFAYAFKVFSEYRGIRKVSIFGSARSGEDDPNYELSRQFGAPRFSFATPETMVAALSHNGRAVSAGRRQLE